MAGQLPQIAMFADLGPAEVPAETPPAADTAPPAEHPEPEPYPAPDHAADLGPARTLLAPWWDGRLVWGSVDRAAGYKGRPGWYRLHGATTRPHHDGYLVALDVSDQHGTRWTDTRLAGNTIYAEARPGDPTTTPPAQGGVSS